jgi:hypothetical protein
MSTAHTFTAADKLKAVEREVSCRHRVYARRVSERKMTAAAAQHEIGVMMAIADDYRAIEEKERLI